MIIDIPNDTLPDIIKNLLEAVLLLLRTNTVQPGKREFLCPDLIPPKPHFISYLFFFGQKKTQNPEECPMDAIKCV